MCYRLECSDCRLSTAHACSVSFEEPENEIRWRIDHLAHAFDIPSASVKNLKILDLTRERDPWMFKERDRELIPTDRWTWLLKEFEAIKPMFIAMDNKTRFSAAIRTMQCWLPVMPIISNWPVMISTPPSCRWRTFP